MQRYLELASANDFEGLQRQNEEDVRNGKAMYPSYEVVITAIRNKNVEMFQYLMETMRAEWDVRFFFEAAADLQCTKYLYDAWMADDYWRVEFQSILEQGNGIAQAAYKGSLECLEFFHTHGPKPVSIKTIGNCPVFVSLRAGHMDCLQFCLDNGYQIFGQTENLVEKLSNLAMHKEIDWSIPLFRDIYFDIYRRYPTIEGRIADLIKPQFQEFEKHILDAWEDRVGRDVIKHVLLSY